MSGVENTTNGETRRITTLLSPLRQLHEKIRDAIVSVCEQEPPENLTKIAEDGVGDTIYAVDKISESLLIDFFEREIAPEMSLILIAEGLSGGRVVLPRGTQENEAVWRIIVDPIDGTRGLMYQKRSGWILTGVAPNRGSGTNLQDIALAIQTEIPLVKQHLSDQIWAFRGEGVQGERFNRISKEKNNLYLKPSKARTIAHGFATISRFFPGVREELAAIDEEIVRFALGPVQSGKAHCFEDQYICTGGQLYEMMAGHDRFIADIRPLMEKTLDKQNLSLGICCHPYDICTELIGRELGIIITDIEGRPLKSPLNIHAPVSWVGYANENIRQQIEPLLQSALRRRGLLT